MLIASMGSMARESTIRRSIRKWIEAQGGYCTTVHGGAFGKRGEADLIACLRGRYVWIETKTAVGRAEPIQLRRLSQVRLAGGIAVVARSIEDVKDVLWSMNKADTFDGSQKPPVRAG